MLAGSGDDKVHLLVVMTAERGLCGGFNSNTAKAARLKIEELKSQGKEVKIITVGKKGREVLDFLPLPRCDCSLRSRITTTCGFSLRKVLASSA